MEISLQDIIPISDLIHSSKKIITKLKKYKRPLVITQNGKASMVCLDLEEYQKTFQKDAFVQALKEGVEALEKGDYENWDDFKKELEKM